MKKIYAQTIIKYLLIIGATGGTLIGGYFYYLSFLGLITIGNFSGDMVCAGTDLDTCIADISFCVNKIYGKVNDIFWYPTNYDPWGRNTSFDFDPAVKDWRLLRRWGNGFREYNVTTPCRSSWCGYGSKSPNSRFFAAFREGKCYEIRLLGYKYNSTDTIKWGAFDGEIDPKWIGTPTNETPINETPSYNETHEWEYEPESKTWIIVPKPEFRGGGDTPTPPEESTIVTANATTTTTTSCIPVVEEEEICFEDYCINKTITKQVCDKVISLGIMNVYEDNKWKKVEDARSLKGKGFNIVYLEDDSVHKIDVIDFNYSSIQFEFFYDENSPNISEFEYELEDGKMKTKYKIIETFFNKTTGEPYYIEIEHEIEIEEGEKKSIIYSGNPFGKKFKLGDNSTTVIFQPDATNASDAFFSESAKTTNYGGANAIQWGTSGTGTDVFSLINWNFTRYSIPDGATIDYVIMELYVIWDDGADDDVFAAYPVNVSWHEDVITWNNFGCNSDCIGSYNNSWNIDVSHDTVVAGTNINFTLNKTWYQKAVREEIPDYGIFVKGSTTNAVSKGFASSEFATPSKFPKLFVGYTVEVGDTCSCSPIQAGNPIDCSENCDIEACDANGQDILFFGTGTITISGDVTNHGTVDIYGTDSSNKCYVKCLGGCF